jgi:hypothetical protein
MYGLYVAFPCPVDSETVAEICSTQGPSLMVAWVNKQAKRIMNGCPLLFTCPRHQQSSSSSSAHQTPVVLRHHHYKFLYMRTQ